MKHQMVWSCSHSGWTQMTKLVSTPHSGRLREVVIKRVSLFQFNTHRAHLLKLHFWNDSVALWPKQRLFCNFKKYIALMLKMKDDFQNGNLWGWQQWRFPEDLWPLAFFPSPSPLQPRNPLQSLKPKRRFTYKYTMMRYSLISTSATLWNRTESSTSCLRTFFRWSWKLIST